MTNDELDTMRDEVLRHRFCELLWTACEGNKRRYLGWLETIAESRLPVDAMRTHLRSILAVNAATLAAANAARDGEEYEAARKARKAREREDAFRDGAP